MAVVMVWVNVWKEDCSKLARRQREIPGRRSLFTASMNQVMARGCASRLVSCE